jgi:death on curing protein
METFLSLNGYKLKLSDDDEYQLVMQVAQGMMSKEDLAVFLKQCVT